MPPRVSAAVLRTMWNGWTTARRFQQHGKCLLCCGHICSEDSVEHYAVCQVAIKFGRQVMGVTKVSDLHCVYGRRKLRIPLNSATNSVGLLVTLGLCSAPVSDEHLTLRALWCYALYRTTQTLRHGEKVAPENIPDLLAQYAIEGVRGHTRSTSIFDHRFSIHSKPADSHEAQEASHEQRTSFLLAPDLQRARERSRSRGIARAR